MGSMATSKSPQHHTVESVDTAHVRCPPAETETAVVINDGENAMLRVVVPFPSCPTLLLPVHHTVPSRTMHEWLVPKAGDDSTGGDITAGVFVGDDEAGD